MKSLFDIFKIEKADTKNCPPTRYAGAEETIYKLMDIQAFQEHKEFINNHGMATVVLGYWRKVAPDEVDIETYEKFYVLDTKSNQDMILQHRPDKGYDLLIFYTDTDKEGNPIEDEKDRIKGSIVVDGTIVEECTDETRHSKKLLGALSTDLAIQIDHQLRAFSLRFKEEKNPKPKKKQKKSSTARAKARD